jgi:hypothetical protein
MASAKWCRQNPAYQPAHSLPSASSQSAVIGGEAVFARGKWTARSLASMEVQQ